MQKNLLLGSFVVLPYASYLGLVGAGIALLQWLATYPQKIWQRLHGQGWVWLMAAMGVSVLLAENPAQAALQSANFWPFFIFFAGLSVYLSRLPNPLVHLEQWAFWLLVTSIPLNLRAFLEYWPALATRMGWFPGLLDGVPVTQRVDSVFDNPNVFAAYLVILFGLGLGLCLQTLPLASPKLARSSLPPSRRSKPLPHLTYRAGWVYAAMALIPIGIFCSGSRNGILVLMVQLLMAMALMRQHRWALGLSLGTIVATLAGVLYWGAGGRSLVESLTSSSVRLDVWQLSLPLIRQHPWFGIGFSSFPSHYEPGSVAGHPFLPHVHNLWLHLTLEAGFPVMLMLTGIVCGIGYRAVRCYTSGQLSLRGKSLLVGYGLGFFACVLFSLFDLPLFDARVNLLGWLMLAVLQALPDQAGPMNS